jgi:hypothetical protein
MLQARTLGWDSRSHAARIRKWGALIPACACEPEQAVGPHVHVQRTERVCGKQNGAGAARNMRVGRE